MICPSEELGKSFFWLKREDSDEDEMAGSRQVKSQPVAKNQRRVRKIKNLNICF